MLLIQLLSAVTGLHPSYCLRYLAGALAFWQGPKQLLVINIATWHMP